MIINDCNVDNEQNVDNSNKYLGISKRFNIRPQNLLTFSTMLNNVDIFDNTLEAIWKNIKQWGTKSWKHEWINVQHGFRDATGSKNTTKYVPPILQRESDLGRLPSLGAFAFVALNSWRKVQLTVRFWNKHPTELLFDQLSSLWGFCPPLLQWNLLETDYELTINSQRIKWGTFAFIEFNSWGKIQLIVCSSNKLPTEILFDPEAGAL